MSVASNEARPSRWWAAAVAVLMLAAGLRLAAAWSTPLTTDERDHLNAARVHRFLGSGRSDDNVPAGAYRLNHPLLAVALIRVPLTLGQDAPLAVRLPFVILSVVGLAFVYPLARRAFGPLPSLMGLLFLSVDQFHIIRSRTASEAVALSLVPIILYVFYRSVAEDRPNLMALVGLIMGVAYHGKEDTLLLVPALGLFLLARRSRWRWFRRKELYLGLFILAALVGVDLYFNLSGSTNNLARLARRTAGIGITLRGTSLYLGELLIRTVRDPAAFVWAQDRWSWEVPAMNWVAGLVCLTAAVLAIGRHRTELTGLLVWVFWVVFVAASIVAPSHGFFELDLKKWAGTSMIPAAILAGELVYRRARAWRVGQLLAAVLFGYLIANGVRVSLIRENVYSLPPPVIQRRRLVPRPAPPGPPPLRDSHTDLDSIPEGRSLTDPRETHTMHRGGR